MNHEKVKGAPFLRSAVALSFGSLVACGTSESLPQPIKEELAITSQPTVRPDKVCDGLPSYIPFTYSIDGKRALLQVATTVECATPIKSQEVNNTIAYIGKGVTFWACLQAGEKFSISVVADETTAAVDGFVTLSKAAIEQWDGSWDIPKCQNPQDGLPSPDFHNVAR